MKLELRFVPWKAPTVAEVLRFALPIFLSWKLENRLSEDEYWRTKLDESVVEDTLRSVTDELASELACF